MYRTHIPLTKWFLAMYFVSQDKRGISPVQLASTIGVPIRRHGTCLLGYGRQWGNVTTRTSCLALWSSMTLFFGGPTVGKKRGRGTEKTKVFVALSLDCKGNPQYLKMKPTKDVRQASVRDFAHNNIARGCTVLSDGYRSYVPALPDYVHNAKVYDPAAGMLRWLHVMISNAKAFILGTYHGLPAKNIAAYLDEFCFRFCRRSFGAGLLDRLTLALANSRVAD